MTTQPQRRHVHTRSIRVDAYARDDGLWDVEAPGHCGRIEPAYKRLVGLNLARDFRRHVRERLGGVHGCTHLTELAGVLPTAAIQGFAGEARNQQSADRANRKPFQLDRCHALVTTGAAVAKFYPRWFRGEVARNAAGDTEQGESR